MERDRSLYRRACRDCVRITWPAILSLVLVSVLNICVYSNLSVEIGEFCTAVLETDGQSIWRKGIVIVLAILCYAVIVPAVNLLQDYLSLRFLSAHDSYIYGLFMDKQYDEAKVLNEGEVRHRMENDVIIFRRSLIGLAANSIAFPLMFVFVLYQMAEISLAYGIGVCILSFLKLIIPSITGRALAAYEVRDAEYGARAASILMEMVKNPCAVKLLSLKESLTEYSDKLFQNHFHKHLKKKIRCQAIAGELTSLLEIWITLMAVLLGLFFVSRDEVAVGAIASMVMLVSVMHSVMEKLEEAIRNGSKVRSFGERILYFYVGREEGQGEEIGSFQCLEARHLSFGYPVGEGKEEEVFRDLNFCINKGDKVAVLGENGSGKTTLIELISLFHYGYGGHLLVNGHEITQLNPDKWRKHLSVAFQTPLLFEGSVKENIALGNGDRLEEKAEYAMGAAGIRQLSPRQISGLQEKLSGGEQQRISIARAAAKEAEILILDEPTNHLDQESLTWLKRMIHTAEQTVIVITHDVRMLEGMEQVIRI